MDLWKPREKWLIVSSAAGRSGKIRFENVDKLSQQKPDSTWLKRQIIRNKYSFKRRDQKTKDLLEQLCCRTVKILIWDANLVSQILGCDHYSCIAHWGKSFTGCFSCKLLNRRTMFREL